MSSRVQRICILGATGSIGTSTLAVIARHPQRYEVFALTGQRRVDELFAQIQRFKPRYAALPDTAAANALRARVQALGLRTEVLAGARALEELAAHPQVDQVMAAIVGAAGLPACLAAARAGKRLLLANKEALVVGGALFMEVVRVGGATLIPIDSEHSAVFQCLPPDRASWDACIDHIVLTASGGPFRDRDPQTLSTVTPEQACAHPNWDMGQKISVDSATMMNKALEVIEARWLFDLAPERIKVLVHPQSIIHSMVVARDGAVLAQLGTPDMRAPISYGLSYPRRIESGAPRLDFSRLGALTFQEPDRVHFPGLFLSWDALNAVAGSTAVLNAANEIAVAAFLEKRLSFDAIYRINSEVLQRVIPGPTDASSIESLLALDERTRAVAREQIAKQ